MRGILSVEKLANALEKGAKEYLALQSRLCFFQKKISNDEGQWRAYNLLVYLNELELANLNKSDYAQQLLALTVALYESTSVNLANKIARKLITGDCSICQTSSETITYNTLASSVFSADLLEHSTKISTVFCDNGSDSTAIIIGYHHARGVHEITTVLQNTMCHPDRLIFKGRVTDFKMALATRHKAIDHNILLSHSMRWINPQHLL